MRRIKKIFKKIKNRFGAAPAPEPFYTKDIFANEKFIIGEYTYGKPKVIYQNDEANLIIGKFCSISSGVVIFLGGNHRTDWITTFPFNAIPNDFHEARNIKGH